MTHRPRLREIADATGMTERTVYGIVADLANAGYIIKEKDGRRNRYRVQPDHAMHEATTRAHTLGELIDLLVPDTTPTVSDDSQQCDGGEPNS